MTGCEIVIATPGRLNDFISTGDTNMKRCSYLVSRQLFVLIFLFVYCCCLLQVLGHQYIIKYVLHILTRFETFCKRCDLLRVLVCANINVLCSSSVEIFCR